MILSNDSLAKGYQIDNVRQDNYTIPRFSLEMNCFYVVVANTFVNNEMISFGSFFLKRIILVFSEVFLIFFFFKNN